jgi:hypothetical protein
MGRRSLRWGAQASGSHAGDPWPRSPSSVPRTLGSWAISEPRSAVPRCLILLCRKPLEIARLPTPHQRKPERPRVRGVPAIHAGGQRPVTQSIGLLEPGSAITLHRRPCRRVHGEVSRSRFKRPHNGIDQERDSRITRRPCQAGGPAGAAPRMPGACRLAWPPGSHRGFLTSGDENPSIPGLA